MPEVSIRPITYDDTEDIIRWRNSDSVRSRFIDKRLFTKESHERWLKEYVEKEKRHSLSFFLTERVLEAFIFVISIWQKNVPSTESS